MRESAAVNAAVGPFEPSLSVSLESPQYFPAFDWLRILLALGVAADHSRLSPWRETGTFCVQIFFALSGWLIGGILLRERPQDLPRFYFNRAMRIWIPYAVAVALIALTSIAKQEPVTQKWLETFFYDVTFTYDFFGPPQLALFRDAMPLSATGNHFWSICAEEQFYLLAPLLLVAASSRATLRGTRPLTHSILFWLLLSAAALASPLWDEFGAISAGVLAAVVHKRFEGWHLGRAARIALALAAVASGLAIASDAARSMALPAPAPVVAGGGSLVFHVAAPIFAVALVLLLAQPGRSSRVGAFLGAVSFPLYLNQWIGVFVANAAFRRSRDSLACHVTGVFLAFLGAVAVYILVDAGVRARRSRWFTRKRGLAVAIVGFALVAAGVVGAYVLFPTSPR